MVEGLPHGGEPLLDIFVQRGEKLRQGPFGHGSVPELAGSCQDNGNFGPNNARQAFRAPRRCARCAHGRSRASRRGSPPQQVAGSALAGVIHAVADGGSKAGGIRPLIENSVGKRREKSLHLVIEPALPSAVKAFERHDLDQERRLNGLLAVPGLLFQYFTIRTSPFHSFEKA